MLPNDWQKERPKFKDKCFVVCLKAVLAFYLKAVFSPQNKSSGNFKPPFTSMSSVSPYFLLHLMIVRGEDGGNSRVHKE